MNEQVKHIIESLLTEAEILTEEEIATIVSQFPFSFPASYIDVIRFVNGQEGEIGPGSWICLFPIEELAELNNDYKFLMEDAPDYFLIGKDAADTGYAFHKVQGTFHSFGLMSNFETDFIDFMGQDFYEFLETLYNYRFKTQQP